MLRFRYFEFDHKLYNINKVIFILERFSIIYGPIYIHTLGTFNNGPWDLQVGVGTDMRSIGSVVIGPKNQSTKLFTGDTAKHMTILDQTTKIGMTLRNNDSEPPTQGNGFGILSWLKVSDLPGFGTRR